MFKSCSFHPHVYQHTPPFWMPRGNLLQYGPTWLDPGGQRSTPPWTHQTRSTAQDDRRGYTVTTCLWRRETSALQQQPTTVKNSVAGWAHRGRSLSSGRVCVWIQIEPFGRVYLESPHNVQLLPREALSWLFDECSLSALHTHTRIYIHVQPRSLECAHALSQESVLSALSEMLVRHSNEILVQRK